MSFSSDYDKFKDKKKKKVLYYNKDREQREGDSSMATTTAAPMKQTIILAKPEREKEKESDKTEKSQSSSSQVDNQGNSKVVSTLGTFTIKTRDPDSRAVSPSCQKTSVLRKESDGAAPTYQIATKAAPVEAPSNPLQLPASMTNCARLIDDTMQMCETALEHLADQNDFLVVGVIGAQSVGKSFIMSALAGRHDVFRSCSSTGYRTCGQCTTGVDMYVTGSRMVLLDTPPTCASTVMDYVGTTSQLDKKLAGELAPSSSENASELQSTQISAFLMAVCHVVILIDDWLVDTGALRCLLEAEMLKPSTSTTSGDDQIVEYFPHVIFLKNRATPTDFMPSAIQQMQELILLTLEDSRLHTESGMSISTGKVIPHLTPDTVKGNLNIFLLPIDDDHDQSDRFRGHPGFSHLIKALRHQILSASHQSLTPSPLSERHWFHYASKTLENVKKSSLFMEFSRFLP